MTKLEDVITGLVSIVIACAFLLWIDWRVALASVAGCALALAAFGKMENITKGQAKIRQEQAMKLTGAALEYSEGIQVIKALRMAASIGDACRHAIDFESALVKPVTRYLNCYAFAIAAALFIFRIYLPAMGLATSASMMRVMEAGLDRYEKLKDVPIIDADGKDIELKKFDIEFDHVSFSTVKQKPCETSLLPFPKKA
jgi:ATP-binding cassette subfamily B protein